MKDIIIGWLVFQLVILGLASVNIEAEIQNKTYKCQDKNEVVSVFEYSLMGIVFPLVAFVPDKAIINNYCGL